MGMSVAAWVGRARGTGVSPAARAALLWALWLSACALPTGQPLPPAAGVPPASVPDRDANFHYVLHRGDEIEIKAFNLPELNERVVIRPDGMISLTLLDEIRAADRTTNELDAELTVKYAAYFTDPQVTVIVREFANLNVYVGGEVGEPGIVPLEGTMTSLMAVFRAGGFRDTAELRNVIVLRNAGRDTPELITVDMRATLSEGVADLVLRPFDVIFVPKSRIAKVNLFVEQYVRRVLPFAVTGSVNYTYLEGDRINP